MTNCANLLNEFARALGTSQFLTGDEKPALKQLARYIDGWGNTNMAPDMIDQLRHDMGLCPGGHGNWVGHCVPCRQNDEYKNKKGKN